MRVRLTGGTDIPAASLSLCHCVAVQPPKVALRISAGLFGETSETRQLAAESPGSLEEGLEAMGWDAETFGDLPAAAQQWLERQSLGHPSVGCALRSREKALLTLADAVKGVVTTEVDP